MSHKKQDEEVILPNYVIKLLKKVAENEEFTDYSFYSTTGFSHGDGFMSVIIHVLVIGQKDGQAANLHLIVKIPHDQGTIRQESSSAAIFEREIFMYEKILPWFVEFQKTKNLSDDNSFLAFPKCYITLMDKEANNYVIVLEDLRRTGHRMFNKFEEMDKKHINLVLEEIAKFHAISFAIRDQQPEVFNELRKMEEVFLEKQVVGQSLTKNFIDFTFDEAIKSLDSTEIDAIKIMTNLKNNFISEMRDCVGYCVAEPFSVVNHGDLWNNNLQFKYDKSSSPTKAVFIDWQLSRFASPVLDVILFILSSTTTLYCDDLYEKSIHYYYQKLVEMIKLLGSDPEKMFSYNDLQMQIAKFGKFSLLTAPMMMQVICANPMDTPTFDDVSNHFGKDGSTPNFEEYSMFITTKTKSAYKLQMNRAIKYGLRLGK